MPKATTTTLFQNLAPEYVAVILASSEGARLFPVTSSLLPKHMMPICGIPVLSRLLASIEASGFEETVVVISRDDKVTIPYLKEFLVQDENDAGGANKEDRDSLSRMYQITQSKPTLVLESTSAMKITVLSLHEDCFGSVDALRKVEEAALVPSTSNIMVIAGDLVVLDPSVLRNLCDIHRHGYKGPPTSNALRSNIQTACSVLLADVGEIDEHGVPLKESAKQKKGGVARDEEDIEYIALSYNSTASSSSAPRLVWKQLKIDVHDNHDMVAETPKLKLPKPRLRVGGITRVRTDWSDRHVYIFSPWVRRLIVERKQLISLQGDLIPLLVSRQFRGIAATFGGQVEQETIQEVLSNSPDLTKADLGGPNDAETDSRRDNIMFANSMHFSNSNANDCLEYAVLAHVQNEALRTNTISSYLHACRETLAIASAYENAGKNPGLQLPQGTQIRNKFFSILLPEATTGDKVTFKSVSVGRRCKLGNKCRLNNVVIMDDVTIGDNVILQNSIIGSGCKIGDNCNLNDCQVAPGKDIPSGEKAKGESFSLL